MNNIIENCGRNQFASGQSSRDLRINSDVMKPETQLDVNATEQCPGVEPEKFPAPIGKFLGLKLLQAANGIAVVEFVADERHANPMGTLHGGVLCDIADAANGLRLLHHARGR
jgi:acyl-coenzyme A thioesterase PaaI-like protein